MGDSVARVLEARAEAHPDRLLFSFVSGSGAVRQSYTYESFLARTSHVGRCLLEAGLAPGETTLLVFPPGLDMAVAFFAAIRIGVIPVPAPPPSHLKLHAGWGRLAHIAADAGARYVLATADLVRRVAALGASEARSPAGAVAALGWIATDAMEGGLASPLRAPSEPLFIQYTSGSTSAPRGVAVSHANALHNARFAVGHDRPVGVSWLPHFHDMGLLGYYLFSLIRGGEATCFSPLDFLRRPVLWLELVSRTGATITTAPNAAYEYCLRADKVPDEQIAGLDLGSLRFMVNAAEPVRAGTFERFFRRFSAYGLRREALVTAYGLAEHTLCVTTGGSRIVERDGEGPGDAGPPEKARFVSCGRPEPDVDIRIVDPGTRRRLGDGAVGEIWVDSASKATAYWRKPELSDRQFRAVIAGARSDRKYLRTGDLGFLDGGELFVCGRLRDMLVLNGRNVFPGDIEALLEEALPALAGRVAAFGMHSPAAGTEELVILIEAGADSPDLARVRCVVQERAGIQVGVVARMPRGAILRTSSGKIARRLCRENFESGAVRPLEILAAAGDMPATTIEALIDGLVAQAAGLGNPDATLDQLGLDSIAFVNLSLALEELLEEEGLATLALIEQVSDLSLLQALRVNDLRGALGILRSGQAGAQSLLRVIDGVAGQVREDERARMRADAAMALPVIATMVDDARPGHALVTGATGFLGGYLLRSLLNLTDEAITVLVRADSPVAATARIRRTLLDTGMAPAAVARALQGRVGVVVADLTLPRFGLDDRAWQGLASRVDRVYHSAAEVDYVKSYNLLRPANVAGTREVIGLAAQGRRKALHYISTTFVFGWSVKPFLFESDANPAMQNLDFGYAQSKWVSEQLVLRAARAGLPVTVYRPSLVTASAHGRFVRRDITARVVGYMIRRGLTVDAPNQVSFLPVDLTARNIVALSRSEAAAGSVLHMTSDEHFTIGDVCRHIAERFGYAFRETSLEGFVAHAHAHCGPDDDLYPLLSFLDRNTARIVKMGAKRYDSTAYRAARDTAPLALQHPIFAATVDPIVAYLRAEGLIPPAPRRHLADTVDADAAEALV